ncbi:MAG: VanZ family protein [Candidatus Rokubacteria bacterium]|nr:VanZ family protein [Candidatus Rokubacteria bacterium]
MRLDLWGPPVAWTAVILWLASDAGSAEQTSRLILPMLRALLPGASPEQLATLHVLLRKAAHFVEYALLAWLWGRALVVGRGIAPRSAAVSAWAMATACAAIDESVQAWHPSRVGSVGDVLIDTAGALAAAGWWWRRPTPSVADRGCPAARHRTG